MNVEIPAVLPRRDIAAVISVAAALPVRLSAHAMPAAVSMTTVS